MTSVDLTGRLLSFLDERVPAISSVLLGVSGGCDSMVLMDVFSRIETLRDTRGYVVHYNHRLHDRADQAEEFVRSAARERNLEVITASALRPETMGRTRRGLEAEARDRRYDFFRSVAESVDVSPLLLAHHRRDQVETLLLNLGRGTGPGGLSGIEPVVERDNYMILRPFLSVHPDDLREYVHRRGLNYLEDPTNEDLDRARNRIRYRILPEWETVQPDPESAIYGLGERMKRENNFWEHYLSDRFEESIYPGEIQVNRETFRTAHSAAQFRYLHHLVTKVLEAGQGMSTKNYEDLRNLFTEGRSGAWLSLPDPLYALNEYDRGSISTRRPPELIELQSMDPSLEVSFGEEGVLRVDDERELLRGPRRTYYSRISENSVEEGTIRTWEEGDCFQRDGALSKLTEFFDDWKIPYRARRCWPLLAVEGTIVAVPGFFHEQNLQSDSLYFGFSSEHPLFELVGSKGPRSEPPNIL